MRKMGISFYKRIKIPSFVGGGGGARPGLNAIHLEDLKMNGDEIVRF